MSQLVANRGVRWRLGVRTRKGVLLVHIASGGVWLGIDVVLTALVLVALAPQVAATAEQARRFVAGEPAALAVGDLIFPPIVSPTALLVAFVLAVYKPWGRIRAAKASREGR